MEGERAEDELKAAAVCRDELVVEAKETKTTMLHWLVKNLHLP